MTDHATLNPIIAEWEKPDNINYRPGFIRHLIDTANLGELKVFIDMEYIKKETGRIINEG